MRISIRRGLDIPLSGAPRQLISQDGGAVRSVALLGVDFPDVRPHFSVALGDRVAPGQTLFVDRRRPSIAFTSPVDGTVAAIRQGPRRSLDALVIEASAAGAEPDVSSRRTDDSSSTKDLVLAHGLWPAFRARPFGRIPDPDSQPASIFVTAVDTNPLAANPATVIAEQAEFFRQGLGALTTLTPGQIFVCQAPGPRLSDQTNPRITCVHFDGPHPSGLPGTHIHILDRVRNGRCVWHIGYQDVISVGHLLVRGAAWMDRIVAVAGPGVRDPQLVRAKLGANLDDLLDGRLNSGNFRLVSGSALGGRASGFLARYHTQVSVLPALRHGPRELPLLSRLLGINSRKPQPLIPQASLERVNAFDIPAVPLLRALSVGDTQTAEQLGCTEMIEEDLALLSYVCASGTDYGVLLRSVLDDLQQAA